MRCQHCSSTDLYDDGASSYCTQCGTVVEESQIVSDVTFAENSAGGAVVQGSYVGNEQRGARTTGPGGFRTGGVGVSREQTVANAKHAIRALGFSKRVPPNTIDKAGRLFTLALEGGTYRSSGTEPKNYVLGRKSEYTQASCLYVACRMDRTNHMLIDFADAIGVNVFVLGRSYLRLVRCLGFRLPVIDPSIYISRFASLLDFGDETQRVATDATRLVQRFNKDWITHGRRPAGICGACLLLAARMNNFRRSIAEVVQVVKIADVTLRKRLEDFQTTPSSRLSIDDFRNIWLEEEHEPPAYYIARIAKKPKAVKGKHMLKHLKADGDEESAEESDGQEADDEDREDDRAPRTEAIDPRLEALADQATEAEIARYLDEPAAQEEGEQSNPAEGGITKRSGTEPPEGNDELAGLDEEELNAFILDENEVKIKERVWIEFNRDYLEKTLVRQLKMEADIKAGIAPKPTARRKRKQPLEASAAPISAAESTKQLLRKKKFSKKLNYSVIENLFEDGGSASGSSVKKKRRRGSESEADGAGDGNDEDSDNENEEEVIEDGDGDDGDDGDDDNNEQRPRRPFFASDAETDVDDESVVEESGTEVPANSASRRRRSRAETKQRAARDAARSRSVGTATGDESGTERGTSHGPTDGETEGESERPSAFARTVTRFRQSHARPAADDY